MMMMRLCLIYFVFKGLQNGRIYAGFDIRVKIWSRPDSKPESDLLQFWSIFLDIQGLVMGPIRWSVWASLRLVHIGIRLRLDLVDLTIWRKFGRCQMGSVNMACDSKGSHQGRKGYDDQRKICFRVSWQWPKLSPWLWWWQSISLHFWKHCKTWT